MHAAVWRKGKTKNAADEQAAGMKVGKMRGSMLTGSSGTVLLEDQQRSFLNRIH